MEIRADASFAFPGPYIHVLPLNAKVGAGPDVFAVPATIPGGGKIIPIVETDHIARLRWILVDIGKHRLGVAVALKRFGGRFLNQFGPECLAGEGEIHPLIIGIFMERSEIGRGHVVLSLNQGLRIPFVAAWGERRDGRNQEREGKRIKIERIAAIGMDRQSEGIV